MVRGSLPDHRACEPQSADRIMNQRTKPERNNMRPGGKCLRPPLACDRWKVARTKSNDVFIRRPNTINTISDGDDAGEDDEYDTRGDADKSGQQGP